MSSMPARTLRTPRARSTDVTALIPDFPFEYGKFLDRSGRNALCTVANAHYGKQVLVVGAGVSGMVCAYELMRMGLHPVVLEASDRIGGRLYSKKLGNPGDGVICELGGMRFPVSAKALFHYFEKVGVKANMGIFQTPDGSRDQHRCRLPGRATRLLRGHGQRFSEASRVRPDRRRILHDFSRRRALPFRRDGSGHDGRLHRSRQDKNALEQDRRR